jgi:tellurite resistance protein TerC
MALIGALASATGVSPALAAVESALQAGPVYSSFDVPGWVWVAFFVGITALLFFDLLVVHRKPHAIGLREAAIESAAWVTLGLSFTLVILWWQGGLAAGEYLAGYLIEKSLSVDNVFVWAVILNYFAVPLQYQFRVLFWGIFGALVLRLFFIFAGIALIDRFDWIIYVFGALLLFTAFRVAHHRASDMDPEKNPVLKFVRRVVPVSDEYDGQKMFTNKSGQWMATPLFVVLVLVETTDVVFAVDSIPAILAVSREPFIVFSSNAFAIMGLRALYFLLSGMSDRLRYLNYGLAVILGFVGLKMIAEDFVHVPTWISLLVIASVLAITVVVSLRADREERAGRKDRVGEEDHVDDR